jgi:outer membrane protein OmpA-like peptidoglycan-associated protein
MNTRIVILAGILLGGAWSSAHASSATAATVPLVLGMTLIAAASERQGDYESALTIDSIDADGTMHLTASDDLPDPAGGKPKPHSFTRTVLRNDLQEGRTYKYLFSDGQDEFPGSTAFGTSRVVIDDLRTRGKTLIALDGQPGGLAGMLTGVLSLISGADTKSAAQGYLTASGVLEVAEPKPVPYPMIVNDTLVSLAAWHLKGSFLQNDIRVAVEWYILDDPENALTLRFAFGKDKLDILRITYPVKDAGKILEHALADSRRAVVYGIYFDFNSDVIKPQSEPVLLAIVEVMKRDPDWVLSIEGHTDNIGGDVKNQELSARRAAAVKVALVERGVLASHLNTAGYGASAPKETNATLAGRARNRRVELTRQ